MKKLLFLTARLPYPTTSGRKNVMYYYCKYLNEKYGFQVINVSFLEENDNIDKKPSFIEKTYTLEAPSKMAKMQNLIFETILKQKYPMQVSLYYDEKIQCQVDRIISEEKPDIIMCDMIRTAEYLKKYYIPKILDMDDLLSIRYRRQLKADIENVNPFGAYIYSFPKIIQKILLNNTLKKEVMSLETKLLERYEKSIVQYYDSIVFVAQREADILNKMIGNEKALAVPLGVNIQYFSKSDTKKTKNSISFLGAMNVAHNETAVMHFCNNILPLIIKEIPDVKFYIVGGGVTDKIKKLASDNIIITGRVDDVRPYISKTEVFVCPLLFGSGIKTKNLEAMAMNIPVVTTKIGAESINAIDGKDWMVRDDVEEFAGAVIEILKNKGLAKHLSSNGKQYVVDNFSWDKVMNKWRNVFRYIGEKGVVDDTELIIDSEV